MRRIVIGAIGAVVLVATALSVVMMTCLSAPAPARMPAIVNSASVSVVNQILQKLEWGRIAFNVPQTMKYKEHRVVELLLSPTASARELEAQLESQAGAQSAEIRISNRMEARLTGKGFSIESIELPVQAVSTGETTRWRWDVVPLEHGSRVLHVTLYAHIDVAGSDTPKAVRTFDRPVEVQITAPQRVSGFVEGNWQWLWAAILVPVAGYVWKLLGRRKRST